MWLFYSFLLLFAWNAAAQNSDLLRHGSSSYQQSQGHHYDRYPEPASYDSYLPEDGQYLWGEWGMFGVCSVTCGRGVMRRQRTCFLYGQSKQGGRSSSALQSLIPLMLLNANGDSNSGLDLSNMFSMFGTRRGDTGISQSAPANVQMQYQMGCPGEHIGSAPCGGNMCPYVSTPAPPIITTPKNIIGIPSTKTPYICLTLWGAWGQCSASCGQAVKLRMRECKCKDPISGKPACSEMLTASQKCVESPPCLPKPTTVATTPPPTVPPPPVTTTAAATKATFPPPATIPTGSWASWGYWAGCPPECERKGIKYRRRRCLGSGICYGRFQEFHPCAYVACTPPPPAPEWGEWEEYGDCSTTCGIGEKSRVRNCPVIGKCPGIGVETIPCAIKPCPTPAPEWSQWEPYSDCSASCGIGVKSRSRTCSVVGSCDGDAIELSDCEISQCPEWSQWGAYGDCSASCGEGTKFRSRTCSVKGSCPGTAVETSECEIEPCPTAPPTPVWGEWGSFGDCSTTCGVGAQFRTRTCPVADGCLGFAEEAVPCELEPCPEIIWSDWEEYDSCSKTCGPGQKSRRRTCSVDGQCIGESVETTDCMLQPCSTYNFTEWTAWSSCTATCGDGEIIRTRKCVDTTAVDDAPDVSSCDDPDNLGISQPQLCNLGPCYYWTEWSAYSECSTSCGDGQSFRSRQCTAGNGTDDESVTECLDPLKEGAFQSEPCKLKPCPVLWLEWGSYGDCTTTCGSGLKYRRRICPITGECSGSSSESVECNSEIPCPTLPPKPTWNTWNAFTPCSKTCGVGERSRTRTCSVDGACVGFSAMTIYCQVAKCQISPEWTPWGEFGGCSSTCGIGKKIRVRECTVEGQCRGEDTQSTTCSNKPCPTLPPATSWNSWSPYTTCNATCGQGLKMRYRTCPVAGGCSGSSIEMKQCNYKDCLPDVVVPQWGNWGPFSRCSVTCGSGRRVRFRTCDSDKPCEGEAIEEKFCTNEPCQACNYKGILQRMDCGYPGISLQECKDRDCCYDDAMDGIVWCFYREGDPRRRKFVEIEIPSEVETSDLVERA